MILPQVQKISNEILDLLDQQLETIFEGRFNDLTKEEKEAYLSRKGRIQELRSALEDLQKLH